MTLRLHTGGFHFTSYVTSQGNCSHKSVCVCDYLFLFLTFHPLFQRVPRTGWVYRNVMQPESVSDHMYRMAMMALTLRDPNVNRDR